MENATDVQVLGIKKKEHPLTKLVTKPRRYQKEGAAFVEKCKGRALIADMPGLGKTLQSLLWIHRNPQVRPIVVVCPASCKWQWILNDVNRTI